MKYYDDFKVYYDTYKLENGITIHHVIKKGFYTKYGSVVISAGSKDNNLLFDGKEYKLKSGLFHCLEHKIYEMENGYDQLTKFSSEGIDSNAFTTYDKTEYLFKTTEDIVRPLELTLDFLCNPCFNQESLNKEKKIILSERRQSRDSIISIIEHKFLNALFKNSGLKDPIVGSVKDINSYNVNDLKLVYDMYYNPKHMNIVLVGDYNIDGVNKSLSDYFNKINFASHSLYSLDSYQDIKNNKYIKIKNKNAYMPKVLVGMKMKLSNDFVKEALAYEALLYIILEESSSIYQDMLYDSLITDDAYYYLNYNSSYGFMYFISDTENPLVLKKKLLKLFNDIPRDILNEGLERFKKYSIGDILPTSNNLAALLEEIADTVVLDYNYLDILDIVRSITLEDIKDTALKIELSKKITIILNNE